MADRLLLESDVIKTIDKWTDDNGQLKGDISCIMEECPSVLEVVKTGHKKTCEEDQDSHFKEMRAVLDKYDKAKGGDTFNNFVNEFVVAMYHEVATNQIYKALKVLNDPDIHFDAKVAYIKFLEESTKNN